MGTCPEDRDRGPKGPVIPDDIFRNQMVVELWPPLLDGPASYQLVGGVKAYQGYDG